jgi:hypothetical protein
VAREAGGQHAVEQVDAQPDRLDDPDRIAEAHEVARLTVGEVRERGGQRLEHGLAGLAHGQAAHRVPVEPDGHGALGALVPEGAVGAALQDPELAELGSVLLEEGTAGPLRPRRGAIDRRAEHLRA